MKKFALAMLVMAAATSCNKDAGFRPTPIPFATHPSILRGTWSGDTSASQALSLNLSATYGTTRQYRVSGTGRLDGEALTVTGSVTGGSYHSYLKAQTSPAPEWADLILKRSGEVDLKLECQGDGGYVAPTTWLCLLSDAPTSFKLTQATP